MAEPVTSGARANKKEAFDPTGKTFLQCVAAFLADAKDTHGATIRKESEGRTAIWQQKHHVAHMFAFNKYATHKPDHVEVGKKTIAWSHISDFATKWDTLKFSDILRTKDNTVPIKDLTGWSDKALPDKDKSLAHAKDMLRKAGIGNSGTGMVSSGLKPCKSPCGCKAGRSKHVSNIAIDFKMADLKSLSEKLKVAKAGTLDEYLDKFALYRPLKNHVNKELWHVERKTP